MEKDIRSYDYVEATDFTGLMPAVMEELGSAHTIGNSEEIVSAFELKPKGSESLEVIDVTSFEETESSDGQ